MAVVTRAPTLEELFDVQAIASAAGLRFAEHPDPRIARCADDPPPTRHQLETWLAAGRIWVSVDDALGEPVGFVVIDSVDGAVHVEELSVLPRHQGAGHGTALLEEAVVRCVATGRPAVTLTTFDDVAWNRPFYERRGFRVVDDDEIGPALRARVLAEAERGLTPELRVCMRRDLD